MSAGDILVNVTFAISRADFIDGWVRPDMPLTTRDKSPAMELGESVRARLDEIYGDNGGAYHPDVLSIAVGAPAVSPADLKVALQTACAMLDDLDEDTAMDQFGLTTDQVQATHGRLDTALAALYPRDVTP